MNGSQLLVLTMVSIYSLQVFVVMAVMVELQLLD
jgi:hypothetical protein